MILDSKPFRDGKEVLVLQPRRLAARLLAQWVSMDRGGRLGAEVGYQIRFEDRTGPETRLRFITEGILLRRMLTDPNLEGVGAVILDEFHERHLYTDLTLGRIKALQEERRPDLLLVVMSATLEVKPLQVYFGESLFLESEGRTYPVAIEYGRPAECDPRVPVWERIARLIQRDLEAREGGDVLIFLPGAYEIRRTVRQLESLPAVRGWDILPLFGELSEHDQNRAVEGRSTRPKIIVSTNIAETSITIEGVHWVIDSGLAKIPGHDPRRGLNTLVERPISRFSADQRAGRAGRTGPGFCTRLWREKDHPFRPAATPPEIQRLDLSETVLFLKRSGFEGLHAFPWYEPPAEDLWRRAVELLEDLGALEESGSLTHTGKQMAGFPVHPRFSRMFLYGSETGCFPEMALVAALCQDRSILLDKPNAREVRSRRDAQFLDEATARSDMLYQMRAWAWAREHRYNREACDELGIHAQACRRVEQVARQFTAQAKATGLDTRGGPAAPGVVEQGILLGFADHLGIRRDRGTRRCEMVHGRVGELRRESVLEAPGLLVAAELEEVSRGKQVQLLLGMVSAVDSSWLQTHFPDRLREETVTSWDESGRKVVQRRETRFRDLVLAAEESDAVDPDAAASLLAEGVLEGRLTLKRWGKEVEYWIDRVNFVAEAAPETGFNRIGEEERKLLLEALCHGYSSGRGIRDLDPWPVLKSWIPSGMNGWMDKMVPESISLPGRRRPFRVRYGEESGPTLSATIQELYDVDPKHLFILGGQYPLRLELLAPNRNPVQVLTAEGLDAFWTTSYPGIRKDLMGRYPKHEWR